MQRRTRIVAPIETAAPARRRQQGRRRRNRHRIRQIGARLDKTHALHLAEVLAAIGIVGPLIFGLYRTGQLKDGWPRSDDHHAGAVPPNGRRQFCQCAHSQCLRPPRLGRRLIPWIVRQPFAPSYWAFTFGLSALAISFLRFVERGASGPISLAAPYVSIAVNLAIGGIAAGTLWLLLRGRLLPPPLQPPPESLHPTPRVI
jgi:hypothetical protein